MIVELNINYYFILLPSCIMNIILETACPLPFLIAPITDIVYDVN